MNLIPWRRGRGRERARQARDQAAAEAAESQRRLNAVRKHVVTPLREIGERNQFGDMLAASLAEGRRRGT